MSYGLNQLQAESVSIPGELVNSQERIINYCHIPEELTDKFRANMDIFSKMRNKSFFDTEPRKIREAIAAVFFEIYGSVFKRAVARKDSSRLNKLFLRYAYMDENLLHADQINELYDLLDRSSHNEAFSVYDFQTWLEKILNQEKEPSVNEFGQDYDEVFREKRKRGEVCDRDKAEYDNNLDGRLSHEINNLFKIGQRLCCGQMGGYFPVLHSGMVFNDFSKALVTPEKIESSLNKILEVDFSAFHREIIYNQPGKGVSKELIMKFVRPDFILLPTFGSRAVMWQELTGRARSSPGRFIFPIFTAENLDDLMVAVIAKFRWELSKTMFSHSRNDAQQSSLINDYSNYIQFYKKNRDLSDEAKGKVKAQIDKYRNNVGDIFASDYHTWINYESKGLVRLNKVAREILFKYCPFSTPIRGHLEKHPLYNQLISRFNILRSKQAKIIEAHYNKLATPGIPLDQDLLQNLMYYKK